MDTACSLCPRTMTDLEHAQRDKEVQERISLYREIEAAMPKMRTVKLRRWVTLEIGDETVGENDDGMAVSCWLQPEDCFAEAVAGKWMDFQFEVTE